MPSARPWEYLSDVSYKLLLQTMREDRCREYPILGFEAVAEWFHQMRFTHTKPSRGTLHRWKKLYDLPLYRAARGTVKSPGQTPLFTTNLMLHAWMGSQGRALGLPRFHPFRLKLEGREDEARPPRTSPGPSGIRMRRARARQQAAAILAARKRAEVIEGGQ